MLAACRRKSSENKGNAVVIRVSQGFTAVTEATVSWPLPISEGLRRQTHVSSLSGHAKKPLRHVSHLNGLVYVPGTILNLLTLDS